MTNIKNKEVMTELVRMLYPHYEKYKINTMTPAVAIGPNGKKLSMLVIGDDLVEEMLWNNEEMPYIESSLFLEDNQYKVGHDLFFRFIIHLSDGKAVFETGIAGDEKHDQQAIIDIIRQPSEIGLFVMDERYDLIDFFRVPWQPDSHRDVLKVFDVD